MQAPLNKSNEIVEEEDQIQDDINMSYQEDFE